MCTGRHPITAVGRECLCGLATVIISTHRKHLSKLPARINTGEQFFHLQTIIYPLSLYFAAFSALTELDPPFGFRPCGCGWDKWGYVGINYYKGETGVSTEGGLEGPGREGPGREERSYASAVD